MEKKIKLRKIFSLILILALIFPSAAHLSYADAPADMGETSEAPAASVKLEGIKVVELLTSANAGYIGRNLVADGTYPEEDRGKVVPGSDTLSTNYISRPRELDDYHLAGIYGKAGVPYEIAEVLLSDSEADAKYPGVPKYQALAREISDEVYAGLREGNGVFVVGGSCAPAVGVAGGLRRAYGDDAKIGIIYVDAHGDINTKASTFSGSMGGMDLAPILGLDQEEWWEAASGGMRPLDASIHAAGRDLDSGVDEATGEEFGEMLNLIEAGSNVVTTEEFNDEAYWRAQVKALADEVDVLYLHIDADAVDNAFLPNVNTPEKNGPDIWTVMRNLKIVMETDKVAVVKLASIYFGRDYEENKTRLETVQGFVFPEVPGESPEEASNRASQISILTGIRMISTVFENWQHAIFPAESGTASSDSAVKITATIDSTVYSVNGASRTTDAAPVIIDDQAMVPLRFIAETLGADVTWDNPAKTVAISLDDRSHSLTIGQESADGAIAPVIRDNRTFVPLAYISETLGVSALWNEETSTIEII